jgi:DNA-binding MarR family transcriptional regulator
MERVSAARTAVCNGAGRRLLESFLRRTLVRKESFCRFSMNNNFIDTEYVILENIYASTSRDPPIRQRDLAQIARTSLGMTNSILKRLAQKGWISVKKLNSRNIRYAVTLDGFNEILHRSYGYFKRTIKNVAFYRDAIDRAIQNAAGKNCSTVLLIGNSDLEFIIEHVCRRAGLDFCKSDKTAVLDDDGNVLAVFAEDIPAFGEYAAANRLFLSHLVIKTPAVP